MTVFTDGVTAGIERALAGVSERQRVTANNLANMNTPGFKASRVEFENNLAMAIDRGNPAGASASVVAANTPETADGNNVSVAEENSIMVKSGLQFDALVAALNYKFSTLRIAIEGR